MSLNYSSLPLLLDEKVRTVAVNFFADNGEGRIGRKPYTYLTTSEFEKGDLAVVMVSNMPKVVQVVEMDVPTDDRVEYKWIVDKVDKEVYLANMETHQLLAKEVRRLEQEHKKAQVLEALGATKSKEIKQLVFK